jgi:hypothetical protein
LFALSKISPHLSSFSKDFGWKAEIAGRAIAKGNWSDTKDGGSDLVVVILYLYFITFC